MLPPQKSPQSTGSASPPPVGRTDEDATIGPAVAAAKINAKYVLAGVVVTAVLGTLGAVISNSDKLFRPKVSQTAVTPAQTSAGAESPNISGARDVTIQYGTAVSQYGAAAREEVSHVAGKWKTDTIANGYHEAERSKLVLEFVQEGNRLLGTVTEGDQDGRSAFTREIIDAKIVGTTISFYTRGEVTSSDGTRPYKESYMGTVNKSGDQISFKRIDDLPNGGVAEMFVASRR
jgi:hypothetical protein